MTREADLVHSLVDLADALVADYDVVDLLTGVSDRCVQTLGVAAAGIMLAAPNGELRLVASSSETMHVLEAFELQAEEGPGLDAFRTGETAEDKNLHAGSGRWPRFATAAVEAGFCSVLALPLRLRDDTVGALSLAGGEQSAMSEADALVARAFADLATIAVVHQRAVETQRVNEQLSEALNSRIIIEQAKGIVVARSGLDMTEAFSRLRTYARSRNLHLTDVAEAAIDGTLDPEVWGGASPTTPA